jgi:hypothetical protein
MCGQVCVLYGVGECAVASCFHECVSVISICSPFFIWVIEQPLDEDRVVSILRQSQLLEFHPDKAPHNELFVQGKVANYCIIVLHGSLNVLSQDEHSRKSQALSITYLYVYIQALSIISICIYVYK